MTALGQFSYIPDSSNRVFGANFGISQWAFISPSVRVNERDETWYYGYGVWLRKVRENWNVAIEGSDPGVSMTSRVRLSDGLTLTVMSIHQDDAQGISRMLDERIAGAD